MQMYEDKFESNKTLYFHDLWEYAERKLASADGSTTVITHPCAAKQHPLCARLDQTISSRYVCQAGTRN